MHRSLYQNKRYLKKKKEQEQVSKQTKQIHQ
jgi:hypothetical protein